ncbi:RNA-directed RNA polymerase [Ceratobasidium sp. AG-I]|nr:RNA-directed RNA polymerase [Ceratobasidium sp. AG-I]
MPPFVVTLRAPLLPDEQEWRFNLNVPIPPPRRGRGKLLIFTPESLTLQIEEFSSNRVLHQDNPEDFVLASFGALRFRDHSPSAAADYIQRVLVNGFFLNGRQYRFYHHSNSQLRSRSCWLRAADTDKELDDRIQGLCDVSKINNIAKRAKRIGLLFSGADIDWDLNPALTKDIPDITIGEELFSDGCGLMSRKFMGMLAKKKKIVHRGLRYTPSLIQIRYGVLMVHPELDAAQEHHVHFRDSMRKLKTTADNTFSVVDCSRPYQFSRLNNDIIVLLSALGVTTETLVAKQEAYFQWIKSASTDPLSAMNFLAGVGKHDLAEKVLLDGLDSERLQSQIKAAQAAEVTALRKPDTDKERCRTLLLQSRLLFGACDPYGLLEEGEVHVRILEPRKGATTLTNIDLMVVRNPCLHPGDIIKLRAVHHTKLDHLIDCIIFSGKGKRAAPSMSSGGDLDGDRFTVVWDSDIVPSVVAQSYDYPAPKAPVHLKITRKDLSAHFANYNNMSLGRVAGLHNKWARTLKGAMSPQCQELNALHSQSVDGARIRIPDRLTSPPEVEEPFVLDVLAEKAREFAASFLVNEAANFTSLDPSTAESVLKVLLSLDNLAFSASSEHEVVQMCMKFASRNGLDIKQYLNYINFGGLSAQEKYAISGALDLRPETHPFVWNSLLRSHVVPGFVLKEQNLAGPLPLQRLYSSEIQGRQAFFEYLKRATTDFTRKLIIIKTDARFGVGVFIRGRHPWDEDADVNQDVLVHAFQPSVATGGSLAKPTKTGYQIYASDTSFQLFERHRANTFIFLNFATDYSGNDVNASIALAKINESVRRQIGRIQKTPVETLEIHVVSNRDRVAQEFFDLRFSHVQTEKVMPRFEREIKTYVPKSVKELQVSWAEQQVKDLFSLDPADFLKEIEAFEDHQLENFMQLAWTHNAHAYAFYLFEVMSSRLSADPLKLTNLRHWMGIDPAIVYALIKVYTSVEGEELDMFRQLDDIVIESIILSANTYSISAPMTIERLEAAVMGLDFKTFCDIMWLAACSVRSLDLAADILATLMEARMSAISNSPALEYAHRHVWAICLDRAEEADSECPCSDDGRPRRQRNAPALVPLFKTEDDREVIAHPRIDLPNHVRLHAHVRLQAASQPERGVDPRGRPIMDGVVTNSRKGELRIKLFHTPPIDFSSIEWHLYPAGDVVTSRAMLDSVIKLHSRPNASTAIHYLITGDFHSLDTDWDDESEDEEPQETESAVIEPLPPPQDASDVQPSSGVVNVEEPEETPEVARDWSIKEVDVDWDRFNDSQKQAIRSVQHPLSLVWGPPGTGKTTVVVTMLRMLVNSMPAESKILMTASTHNAVDNVLKRFLQENERYNSVPKDQLLRVATEINKVHPDLRAYTMDAILGGSIVDNQKLIKKAQKRVREATIVFTTCAGAGLGILRKFNFEVVLIDEASQITEACALIPLVKGCQRAVLVGDQLSTSDEFIDVQLRPTVRPQAKAVDFDVSLLERLYTGPEQPGMSRIMLDTQYRFPAALARFPSTEFYNSGLKTGIPDAQFEDAFARLERTNFPWPHGTGQDSRTLNTNVFISCKSEESYGGASKENIGQAGVVMHILELLRTNRAPAESSEPKPGPPSEPSGATKPLSITVLSPYARQLSAVSPAIAANTEVYTIDGFQGREAEVIIFTTVRSNASGDIGFLEDERRLNVALTRAQLGRIVVGNEATLCAKEIEPGGEGEAVPNGGSTVWERAVKDCVRVELPPRKDS